MYLSFVAGDIVLQNCAAARKGKAAPGGVVLHDGSELGAWRNCIFDSNVQMCWEVCMCICLSCVHASVHVYVRVCVCVCVCVAMY